VKKQRIGEHFKEHRGAYIITGVILALIVFLVYFYCFEPVKQAERGETIQQMYEDLRKGRSALVQTRSEAEKKAMEQGVRTYNRNKGYTDEYDQYRIYELSEEDFYISSRRILNAEISLTAGKYFLCLGDMVAGIQTEEMTFLFIYADLEGETLYQIVKSQSRMAEEDIEFREEKATGGGLTIIGVTVKPK